ncbi:hypothetical protein FA15DRAFT_748685 [Coprinopsis marcescibilis]|uniref:F-box domain-containing protein n=1 Tax=Coprinopsis marcescibilis TaxID=230819 RepID=A0A5C3KPJ3_COPMA|nr:hypothetical protein FA15DRAFT_748685 [Coprinopsis marcescibilis]
MASQAPLRNRTGRAHSESHILELEALHRVGAVQTRLRSRIGRMIELELLIRGLKSKRNQLSVTHQLPPELLSRIFVFYKQYLQTPSLGAPKWYQISHVSQYWRDVALDGTQMWSKIQSSPWTRRMLELSKRAPLDVSVWGQNYSSSTEDGILLLRCLEAYASRFNTLLINNISGDIEEWVFRLTTAAPLLIALDIVKTSSNVGVLLPAGIFAGSTPQLRKLQLNGCIPNWSSSVFSKGSRLTFLKVLYTFESAPGSQPPSLNFILQALENMPQLLYLELSMKLAGTSSTNRPPIRLPALQTLKLTGEINDGSAILSRLQLPTFVNVMLYMSLKSISKFQSAATNLGGSCVSSWLSNPLSNPNNTESHCIQSLRVQARKQVMTPQTFKFQAWLSHVSLPPSGSRESHPSTDLSIELTHIGDIGGFESFRECFVSTLPLEQLKCLDMHYNFGSILRLNPFASFPIEKLYIHGPASLHCLSRYLSSDPALSSASHARHPSSTGSPSVTHFRALRTLCVVDMGIEVFASVSPNYYTDFADVLKLRRSLGYDLKTIKLIDRRFLPESMVDNWRNLEAAEEVYWDGVVRELGPDEPYTWDWFEEGIWLIAGEKVEELKPETMWHTSASCPSLFKNETNLRQIGIELHPQRPRTSNAAKNASSACDHESGVFGVYSATQSNLRAGKHEAHPIYIPPENPVLDEDRNLTGTIIVIAISHLFLLQQPELIRPHILGLKGTVTPITPLKLRKVLRSTNTRRHESYDIAKDDHFTRTVTSKSVQPEKHKDCLPSGHLGEHYIRV